MHYFLIELRAPIPLDVLVADIPAGLSLREVLDALHVADPAMLSSIDAVIVRPPVGYPITPSEIDELYRCPTADLAARLGLLGSSPKEFESNFERLSGDPVHLLYSEKFKHALSLNINPEALKSPIDELGDDRASLLQAIQEREMDMLVEAGGAELPKVDGTRYKVPSGRLVGTFLRVGNIQVSRAALDAVFFWLLPHLTNCEGIITDTWSISSVALNLSRRLMSYKGESQRTCPVEMLSQYLETNDEKASEARMQVNRLLKIANNKNYCDTTKEKEINIIFLMSAVSTGTLLNNIKELLMSEGVKEGVVKFVCLYKLGQDAEDMLALRDLSDDDKYSPTEQDMDGAGGALVEIDAKSYFPAYPVEVEHELKPSEHITHFHDQLYTPYADCDLIALHHTDDKDGVSTHHAIQINTSLLQKHPTFRKKLFEKFKNLDPVPKIIVTPGHSAGNEMANFISSKCKEVGKKIEIIQHPNLFISSSASSKEKKIIEKIEKLGKSESLLILDDAFITGSRLNIYQKHLRRINVDATIHYITGVSRPESFSRWEKITKNFRLTSGEKSQVHAVEEIILPDWSKEKCPWCQEQRALRDKGGEDLVARLNQLANENTFETSGEIYRRSEGIQNLSFTKGSYFGPITASEAWVTGCVASSIQRLRTGGVSGVRNNPPLGPRRFPIVTVIKYQEYLSETWTDSLLRAAIIRLSQPYELVYFDRLKESKRLEAACKLIQSSLPTESDLTEELLLGELTGRLPGLVVLCNKFDN